MRCEACDEKMSRLGRQKEVPCDCADCKGNFCKTCHGKKQVMTPTPQPSPQGLPGRLEAVDSDIFGDGRLEGEGYSPLLAAEIAHRYNSHAALVEALDWCLSNLVDPGQFTSKFGEEKEAARSALSAAQKDNLRKEG